MQIDIHYGGMSIERGSGLKLQKSKARLCLLFREFMMENSWVFGLPAFGPTFVFEIKGCNKSATYRYQLRIGIRDLEG